MDFWQEYWLVFVAIVLGIAAYKMKKSKPPTKMEVIATEEVIRAEYEALPKCACGEVARFPAPVLTRDRGTWDWLRSYFAAPPRYKRTINMMLPPVFCQAHVHVADAIMDQFVYRVRNEYAGLNSRIAAEAAGFEQETLAKLVGESLTEQQKRASRKPLATVRVLPAKTGTDDPGNEGEAR